MEYFEHLNVKRNHPACVANSQAHAEEENDVGEITLEEVERMVLRIMAEGPPDPRYAYLGRFVQKTLKLKSDKWGRVINIPENKEPLLEYLNTAEHVVLLVLQYSTVDICLALGFPAIIKSKSVYFIKRYPAPVPKTNLDEFLIRGDISPNTIELLAGLVEEGFVPLLSNPGNYMEWPPVIVQDIQKHLHSLKTIVYQVKAQVSGRTVLPMPVGVERINSAVKELLESSGEIIDLFLKSAIEGVVIKWATLINDVIQEDSSQAFSRGRHPTPSAETNFWHSRLSNLQFIYGQMKEDRVRKMGVMLEKTESAYYPCFTNLFLSVEAALNEAEDIVVHLKPLLHHFAALEKIDFSESWSNLRPLIHVVCLIWANSRHYCQSAKIIVLLRQICNLLILQARRYIDPTSIFESDVIDVVLRIKQSLNTLKLFRDIFDERKENLASYFKDREPVPWTFHPNMVFERFQSFINRLEKLQSFFDTVTQYLKLENIVLGGLQGRQLGGKILIVFNQFNDCRSIFAETTYDTLDPEEPAFARDYEAFMNQIRELDRRLATLLCLAFDDCHNIDSVFKLLEIVGPIIDRPIINTEFTAKYPLIVEMLEKELKVAEELFEVHTWALSNIGRMPVNKYMPPVSGALQWVKQLHNRISPQIINFQNFRHPVTSCERGQFLFNRFERLTGKMEALEEKIFTEWASSVPVQCWEKLEMPLLTRKDSSYLNQNVSTDVALNFHPYLAAVIREVHYLGLMNKPGIPAEALDMYRRGNTFRQINNDLSITVQWYNKVIHTTAAVEFQLIKDKVDEIDLLIEKGQTKLNWNSPVPELWSFTKVFHELVHDLETKVQKTQDNLEKMCLRMEPWHKTAMFQRKDGKRDTFMDPSERVKPRRARYSEVRAAGDDIHHLLKANMKLFGYDEDADSSRWRNYVEFVDSLVCVSLLRSLGCSLTYIVENMSEMPPLFVVNMELHEPKVVYVPSLNRGHPQGFIHLVDSMINDIIAMASLIPRVSLTKVAVNYETEMKNHHDIVNMKREILDEVQLVTRDAIDFSIQFKRYSYLWMDDREMYLQQFLDYGRQLTPTEIENMSEPGSEIPLSPPKLPAYSEQIDKYDKIYLEVEEITSVKVFSGWLQVDLRPFKQALLNAVRKWANMFKEYLVDDLTSSLKDLQAFISEADQGLTQPVEEGGYDMLVNVMGFLRRVTAREQATDEMFDKIAKAIELLQSYEEEVTEEVNVLLEELPEQWERIKKLDGVMRQIVAPMEVVQVSRIKKRTTIFQFQQGLYRSKFCKYPFFKPVCEEPFDLLDKTSLEIKKSEAKMQAIQDAATLFEVHLPEFKITKQCRREAAMLKLLWDYVFVIKSCIDDWKTTPWRTIDVENMDIECKKFAKEIRTMDKVMRSWEVYTKLESVVKNMVTSISAVGELQNPALRERHWYQLMKSTKSLAALPTEVTVRLVSDEGLTLAELLDLNLHECEEEVKHIVDKAVKELSMEKMLRELQVTWSKMEFDTEFHLRTNCNLLRIKDHIIETLEENQVQLQNLMTSKFIAHFLVEVSSWLNKLSMADQIISQWFDVQRTWIHLESIFMSSEDIRRQLPQDSERFDHIDAEFRVMVKEIAKTPNVVEATNDIALSQQLEKIHKELNLCEKALAEYLETKRLSFPRFYFVASTDLMDILSNGNSPPKVARHLTKLFDSMAQMKLRRGFEGNESTRAMGMYAKDGEYVEFNEDCECSGPVELWLNSLQTTMQNTLLHYISKATESYTKKARDEWLFDYPAQVSLCGSQIWWCIEVNGAFLRLENGAENALKEYSKKQVNQLSTLILLLIGELTREDRQKIMTICTIDVHSRDVVSKFILLKIESSRSFQWQSQLRHRWDQDKNGVYADICDAEFRYCHEYLGNTPRLVITPLTDRCYITLTQSLHLIMGGGPQGPAGTGKTETTKDLGRALGMMVYVFNCSEQMDYKSCGNIYKGLAQTGAWGCFDEFNRITVEVLSVVAVQVKSILDAVRDEKKMFNFMGDMINLTPTVGIFVTMNPGYAGRTELPENLKALFRPCAMVVPDFELICEIMLVAEGFQEARVLARKFITLYTLCKELLSKQDHYDWGLRAIKSVLVVAGSLKRGDPGRPEQQVLMRALRDFNIPKIVSDDVHVFMGLIGDLFPSLDVPRKQDLEFEKVVKEAAIDFDLLAEDNFVLKVVQLDELMIVRHSVFVVGNAGTGKTEVWKTLHRTYKILNRRPVFNDLNPKAVTNDELFGIINPSTRDWKDGLFSVIMRDQANLLGDNPKWIVLDGDIDPMWIESLNTVMDDNKILTLASNERIALTNSMRLLFEISNLRTATPATVSRAGILYINPLDLGWNPYVSTWIESRTCRNEKALLINLFDTYVHTLIKTMRVRFKKIIPITEISHVQMLCYLLNCLLTSENTPPGCPKEWTEIYFVFSCVWAFGATMFQDQITDCRLEFSKWWTNEFKTVEFPTQGTVFDYFVHHDSKQFIPWSEKLSKFELDPEAPLQTVLVHTPESIRIRYFLDLLMEQGHPVMLVGNAGVGKTILVNDKLASMSENYAVANIIFNFYTSSEMLQKMMEKPLEKKSGRNYGPTGKKYLIYFIDDMNMPEVDEYGTVQPHTLIRQHMDYGHWYDRTKWTLKDIRSCQYVACMNPMAGSFTINPRLQRHFCVFAITFPGVEALNTIYHSILSQHLAYPDYKFPAELGKMAAYVVDAALLFHQRALQLFLPTAVKFHYLFNLRDLSNVFQGLLFGQGDCIIEASDIVRLWIHETQRIYGDKLAEEKDIDSFHKLIIEAYKKTYEDIDEHVVMEKPNIYCHFAQGIGEPKYMPVKEWGALSSLLRDALCNYNDAVGPMKLVLFEDAMMHICRINRILETPRGSALLVGVGGSGKQSLSRLAAFISSLEVSQIQLRKGYGVSDLKMELSGMYMKSGLKNVGIMFLMTDAQIPNEQFLVVVNDMLANGEIPDLFTDDEVENVIGTVRGEVKGAGLVDTRENCWKFFIDRVRRQLKVVLCLSPVGSLLRSRARKFPAIINSTVINWFHDWPQEALISVAKAYLQEINDLREDSRDSVAQFLAYVHTSVNATSVVFLQTERRHYYTTPKSYLEQINLYTKLLVQKSADLKEQVVRLENGLEKLKETALQVEALKVTLAAQEVVLKQKNEAADAIIKAVEIETEKVTREKALADEEEGNVSIIAEEVTKKQIDCSADLRKALPALNAAQDALNTLNKANLTELKSFGAPPSAVTNVTAAVLVLLAPGGKVPKDRSWKVAKATMAKVDSFLDSLVKYDKENIPPEVIKAIQPYLRDPDFDPEFVRSKSSAAAGICAWVINIIRFYDVYCEVEPKRTALANANAELAAAQNKLKSIKAKVTSLEDKLKELNNDFEYAHAEKMKCQREADATNSVIQLANRLMGGLASENVRWAESVRSFEMNGLKLPGDTLLINAFISYCGCFTKNLRLDLLQRMWLPTIKTIEPPIPITEGLDPLTLLTDDTQIAVWNNEGLPSDRMSIENATILTNSVRWPLMIDPQLQGLKWIKQKYGGDLTVLRIGQKGYLDTIEKALANGSTLLLENIGETLDPVLDPLLGRNFIKKGRAIAMGEREVVYNQSFRLILHTKLANPHYKPEMQAQLTIINFTVTRDGLEEQLLAEVVKAERPDLEELKADLTKQQNDFKILLKTLEDDLLSRLSSASGNILDDTSLVENLENTKRTAVEVTEKVAEAKITSARIDQAREHYRPAAARASLLYFILKDLNTINPIYQFSLEAFSVVFQKAIQKATPGSDLSRRVDNLTDCITYSVFVYTTRGLFERDKLIFSTQMTFQVLVMREEIQRAELDILLRFPIMPNVVSPVDFLSHNSWGAIRSLSLRDEFRHFDRDIETEPDRWRRLVGSDCPEREAFPPEWKHKSVLQKMCMLRALRPDRMIAAVSKFIEDHLGPKYVEGRAVEFSKSFEESSPSTPIFFILSPGVNPLKDVENLGFKLGYTIDAGNLHNVSLGQGQEVVAEEAMHIGASDGHWVILQNIHLVKQWLPSLEKKMEYYGCGSHANYRLFVSAEPAPIPSAHIIPQGILESSIKITNEPPTGMLANLHMAMDNFNQETLDMCNKEAEFKSILFALCYFHAVVAERRKFGPQGWNRIYPFNVGDLNICVNVLYNYLEANDKVPWEDLRYLFGEIMYGGHITDDWDRRLCISYLEEFMHPNLVDGELFLAPGFLAPPNMEYGNYHTYIDTKMPPESPTLYGLHPNAEIGFLSTTAECLFRTVFEMQPRDADVSGGAQITREEKVKTIIDDFMDKLPEEFNMGDLMGKVEDRTPYVVVAFQECERMNILTGEIKRSLRELDLGLKGELLISPEMEELQNALFMDEVPEIWTKRAYPSLNGLTSWFADLLLRLRELEMWTAEFVLPASVWLSGFFNPQSFLTAIMQATARKKSLPLDNMCLLCDVTKMFKDDNTGKTAKTVKPRPKDGAYVHGLFLEGAGWDIQSGMLKDSKLKELFPSLPVTNIRAITQDKQDLKDIYQCPVYKTRTRGQTYVWTFHLKTTEKAQKWTLAGVALLLQI
ncbi:dynein beta chain, ciliary-like [Anabrus simplex]|uniref:dynein beta chain, ciliary-like n=1 Tax=Anabrus simplex TaxID=316456 RepID=UPI0035A3C15E